MSVTKSFLQVAYLPEGLEAIIFTADGDMRQALNNLQVHNTTSFEHFCHAHCMTSRLVHQQDCGRCTLVDRCTRAV